MIDDDAPPWLAGFQQAFAAMLRMPLDRSTGTLVAQRHRYDAALVAQTAAGPTIPATERLAVYNRQYWYRLFTVLQAEYPLTTALVGAWTFNDLATAFVLQHPPTSRDLGDLAEGFVDFVDASLPTGSLALPPPARHVPRAAIVEATTIDAAFRAVFIAPPQQELRLSDDQAARLVDARLDPSDATRIVQEHWPLFELRRAVAGRGDAAPCALPEPHADGPRRWLVCRVPGGERVVPLAPMHARLLELLRADPVGVALARLEAEHPHVPPADLARDVGQWLAQGMSLGLWRGFVGDTPCVE